MYSVARVNVFPLPALALYTVNALIYAYHFLNNSNVNLNPISWKLTLRNDTKAPIDRYLDLNP